MHLGCEGANLTLESKSIYQEQPDLMQEQMCSTSHGYKFA